jgi:retron-type reverse transcriptase
MKINSYVKQGGVISPVLFNYFIHELIEEILALDGEYKIGDSNTAILAYCDDIILLSHSLQKLEDLIKICVKYSTEL